MGGNILLTGANGYIGARTALRILETSDCDVTLWLHASSTDEANGKIDAIKDRFAPYASRVAYRAGELADETPFASVDPSSITGIVHGAAVTRFNVDEETANRVNVAGSEKVFRFAERCPSLARLTYVSTVYASGLRAGTIAEDVLDSSSGFANHYERSKYEAESLLVGQYGALPWSIARTATVIADSEAGNVTQQNAVHNTLKLFYYGLMSLVPGKSDTPLYFVTGDFVAHALADLALAPRSPHAIYHVAHTREESLTLGELVTIAFDTFEGNEQFRSRRILKPLYADAESFDILVDGLDNFGGEVLRQALGSVAPFARQLFVQKDFKNDRLANAFAGGYRAPDVRALVRSMCQYLVRTRWGKG